MEIFLAGPILVCSDTKPYTTRNHEDLSVRNLFFGYALPEYGAQEREEETTQLNTDFSPNASASVFAAEECEKLITSN